MPGWAPASCIGPPSGGALVSAAVDDTPHGRKLYYLHALDASAYRGATMDLGEPSDPAPIGQVLVKEAWTPVKTDAPAWADSGYGLARNHAARDGAVCRTGEHTGLFVMYKVDPSTPGTDRGWVYATVAPDHKSTTSLGRVESCMNCHVHAKHDRQFGLPIDWSRSRFVQDTPVP
ncbi:MAG: cytochrome P460 family protein [Phycisphaerales bacterium]